MLIILLISMLITTNAWAGMDFTSMSKPDYAMVTGGYVKLPEFKSNAEAIKWAHVVRNNKAIMRMMMARINAMRQQALQQEERGLTYWNLVIVGDIMQQVEFYTVAIKVMEEFKSVDYAQVGAAIYAGSEPVGR